VIALTKKSSAKGEPDVLRAESIFSDGRNFAHAANWAFGIGGALTAVGLTWIGANLLSPGPRATVGIATNGASAGVSGVF
jgi:hypothetical protein